MKPEEFLTLVAGFMKYLNERNKQYKIARRFGFVTEPEKLVLYYFEQLMKKQKIEELPCF
ncbi:MAG: hypothetical protein WKI04_12325 [Ferruginibacter sp.]